MAGMAQSTRAGMYMKHNEHDSGDSPAVVSAIHHAQLAQHAKQWEDMLEAIKQLIAATETAPLTLQQRDLVSLACKKTVGSVRVAWRTMQDVFDDDTAPAGDRRSAERYKALLAKELALKCKRVARMVDAELAKPKCTTSARVFFYKMKGDYYRYIAETVPLEERPGSESAVLAMAAYRDAGDAGKAGGLRVTDADVLGLALNTAVFYYDIMSDTTTACNIAKAAFDDAVAEVQDLSEEEYLASTSIMELLRDNLMMWREELVGSGHRT